MQGSAIIAKNRNTFAKQQRAVEKKRKAEEKRQRRNARKLAAASPPPLEVPADETDDSAEAATDST